tara:strand:+ start:37 stop:447 length:411 start_codon:yes stop_codon:yes gene_type:complete
MLIGNSFNLAADISLLIFQYFENPIDGKRNDLVDPELIIRFKIYSRIRLVSKSWYKFEYLSRCRWCSSRYITNSYNKIRLSCASCGHNFNRNSLREIGYDIYLFIWQKKIDIVHRKIKSLFNRECITIEKKYLSSV